MDGQRHLPMGYYHKVIYFSNPPQAEVEFGF